MPNPAPTGVRDVLPQEMRELRAIEVAIRGVLDERGYGEVYTPALEHEEVLRAGQLSPAYRLFDERGEVLALRTDMTVPIARVVATRYADAEPPFRLCYVQRAYRRVRPQRGQSRELLQAGTELIGVAGPEGTAEAVETCVRALDAAGLRGHRVALGSARLFPQLLDDARITGAARERMITELVTRDLVGLEREVRAAGAPADLLEVPQLRGGLEVLDRAGGVAAGLRTIHALLPADVQERVIFDLGLLRDLGYYTGAIFELLDPGSGAPLGGGGRYDELLGRFGRPLPAVGWGLDVARVHGALVGERQGVPEPAPVRPGPASTGRAGAGGSPGGVHS